MIVKVGSREDVLRFKGPRTVVIDRPGAFAMPGLIDAHGHVESLGASLEQVDLRGVSSLDEVARRVQGQDRVRSRRLLDHGGKLGPEPLARWCLSHRRRARCRCSRPTGLAHPGRRARGMGQFRGHAQGRRDQGNQGALGRPDSQRQGGSAHRRLRGWGDGPGGRRSYRPPGPTDLKRRILAAQQQILAAGLTGVHDAGISQAEAQVYRELDRSGQLRLRVYAMASLPAGREVEFVSRPPS